MSTGRIVRRGDQRVLVLTREFGAPVTDVWAAVTEPERLARWIGTWSGDPRQGRVSFAMTAEGEQAPAEDVEIRECEPPHLLRVTLHSQGQPWYLDLLLAEHDGVTTLTFEQPGIDPGQAESVGPGWEYYLDRLVAARSGADVAGIDFERDYYPAMLQHYRDEAR